MANESVAGMAGSGPAGTPALEPRAVGIGRGASWWSEAWRLFTPNVGVWLLITILVFLSQCALSLVSSLLMVIPLVGQLVSMFLLAAAAVLFAGGLMIGCRSVDRGNPLTVGHLFAAFSQRTKPLLLVALLYTGFLAVVLIAVAVIMIALFGVAFLGMLSAASDPSNMGIAFGTAVSAVLVAVLLFLLLWLPVVMMVWFAPALVMLGGVEPWPAMTTSLRACLRNFAPMLVYGAVGLGLAIVASIPFLLGWLVLYPVTVATVYASYCDIFEDKDIS
jgi:uncharacterized membrane protein